MTFKDIDWFEEKDVPLVSPITQRSEHPYVPSSQTRDLTRDYVADLVERKRQEALKLKWNTQAMRAAFRMYAHNEKSETTWIK